MIDPRLTRIFVLPILAVLVLAAFSVGSQPKPLRTFQAPDAYDGATALTDVNHFAAFYPSRPAGGPADDDVAKEIATRFGADGLTVDTGTATVRDPDGTVREATQVYATRPGPDAGVIVVAAARDSVRAGSRAELTGTATLLQLSNLLGQRRVSHPIMLVSVSGTIGQSGYRSLVQHLRNLGQPIRAVIVLGTLGTQDLLPPVVGFSNGPELASWRLRNTITASIRAERAVGDRRAGAAAQLVRLAAPVTTGGQGPLLRAGLPAILFSTTGDRVAPAGLRPSETRLQADGRAVLTSVIAIDNAGDVNLGPEQNLAAADGLIPGWALRVIVFALLVPPALLVIDGLARARRDRQRVGRWVGWALLLALPQLLGIGAVALADALGATNLPDGPIDPSVWNGDITPLAIFAAVTLVGHVALRPLVLYLLGLRGQRSAAPGAPLGLAVVLVVSAFATWAINPAAAAMMVPAALLWPVVLDAGMRPPKVWALLIVLVGLAPILLLLANLLTRYPLGDVSSSASWFVALLTGGDVGLFPQVWFSVLGGCSIGALLLSRHGRFTAPGDPVDDDGGSVRGPAGYAGPGSLGGTSSALDRG